MHYIPGLRLRCSEEAEIIGIDDAEMGEFAYDYVGLEAEIGHVPHAEVGAVGGGREPEHHPHHHDTTPSVGGGSQSEEKVVGV